MQLSQTIILHCILCFRAEEGLPPVISPNTAVISPGGTYVAPGSGIPGSIVLPQVIVPSPGTGLPSTNLIPTAGQQLPTVLPACKEFETLSACKNLFLCVIIFCKDL